MASILGSIVSSIAKAASSYAKNKTGSSASGSSSGSSAAKTNKNGGSSGASGGTGAPSSSGGSSGSSGSKSSTNSAASGTGNQSGSSGSGNRVTVTASGNAPAGTKIGDIVKTAGGDYKVVAANTPGASYNPASGLWSVKVDSGGTTIGNTPASQVSSPSTNSTTGGTGSQWTGSGVGYGPAGSANAYNSGSAGSSGSGKTVQVQSDGNAPAGTKIGDIVVTAGGNYQVVPYGTPGSTYNPANGLSSIKVSGTGGNTATTTPAVTGTPDGYYSNTNTGYVDNGPNMSQNTFGYDPLGSFNDQVMSQEDLAAINSLKEWYEYGMAISSQEIMDEAHAQAEAIRAKYGYSGGVDGSGYIPIELPRDTLPKMGLPVYEAQTKPVENLYDAALESALAALESAYNQSKLQAEAAREKLPALYQEQANTIAANAAKEQANNWEMAAYTGLNRGNGSQMALSMSNQLQGDISALRTAEANAMADVELQLTALYIQYQDSIAEAVANNEYERAAALLQEYRTAAQSVVEVAQQQAYLDLEVAGFNRDTNQYNDSIAIEQEKQAYQRLVENAEALAQFGDFSGYLALGFSSSQVANMRAAWMAANADWAYGL